MFKMKVTSLATVPINSRWRIVWNSYAAQAYDPAAEQFYVGMRTDGNGLVSFDCGTIATQVVGLVIGIPTETSIGPLPGSSFNAAGTGFAPRIGDFRAEKCAQSRFDKRPFTHVLRFFLAPDELRAFWKRLEHFAKSFLIEWIKLLDPDDRGIVNLAIASVLEQIVI